MSETEGKYGKMIMIVQVKRIIMYAGIMKHTRYEPKLWAIWFYMWKTVKPHFKIQ